MEHHSQNIHHIHHLPDAVLFEISRVAELCYEFGAGTQGILRVTTSRIMQPLCRDLPRLNFPSEIPARKVLLEERLLQKVMTDQNHVLVVLHHVRDDAYGWKCLIPVRALYTVYRILQRYHREQAATRWIRVMRSFSHQGNPFSTLSLVRGRARRNSNVRVWTGQQVARAG